MQLKKYQTECLNKLREYATECRKYPAEDGAAFAFSKLGVSERRYEDIKRYLKKTVRRLCVSKCRRVEVRHSL